MDIKDLEGKALEIRQLIVTTILTTGSGHPGGSLSCVDILASLYFRVLNIDPSNPDNPIRDRFVLSKGHAALGFYSTLAKRGFADESVMKTFRCDGSILAGHPYRNAIPGVEIGAGSLGHGLSVGVGMALSAKLDNADFKTYVLIGDGESQEGSIWEAAMSGAHHKLDNLTVIVDRNRLQIDGNTEEILSLEPLEDKWESFGWTTKVIDGHSIEEIVDALEGPHRVKGKPFAIIANTVKGKGVSFMENDYEWHGMKEPIQGEIKKTILADVGL